MATLEERIQNLTQQVNPMGSGVMSDQDVERVIPFVPSVDRVFKMMDETLEPNISVEKRISNLRKLERIKNIPEYKGFGFLDGFRERVLGAGVMTDLDAQRVMQALDGNMATNKMLLSGMQDEAMPMSDVDTSVFQPLVDLGFEQEVRTILTNPMNSAPSVEAQQKIIQELGTGMDVDGFLMEVQKVAPQDVDVAMSNVEAGGDTTRMMRPVSMKASDVDMQGIMSMMGRDGDTTLGHLTEGEVVVPAPVLEANPQASDMLENSMMEMGIDPRTRVVDSTGELGGIASINPNTGLQEFGFLSKLWKKAKNVVKKAAPILPFIPGVGPALSGVLGSAGSAIAGGLSKIPVVGGALSKGATFLGNVATGNMKGLPSLLQRDPNDQGTTNPLIKGIGDLIGFGGRSAELERLINPATGLPYTDPEIQAMSDQQKADAIAQGRATQGGTTLPSKVSEMFNQTQIDDQGNIVKGGMGTGGKFALAGLAGLLGKLAYEEQKKQKGVPLTPLTTMDALGRYNIESEIARRTGEAMPSRVEFGLTAEGLPALSGGMPRNARDGGIMAFAQGGAVAMQEGGEPPINMADFPRKNGEIDGPGTGTSDDIPAMLSDGEFVMTAKAVENAGSYDMSAENGIVTLSPNGGSDRESGTRIMYKLMNHFENLA